VPLLVFMSYICVIQLILLSVITQWIQPVYQWETERTKLNYHHYYLHLHCTKLALFYHTQITMTQNFVSLHSSSPLHSFHLGCYSPFRVPASLRRHLHFSLLSARLLYSLIPEICDVSLSMTCSHLVLGFPILFFQLSKILYDKLKLKCNSVIVLFMTINCQDMNEYLSTYRRI
jgi:hypothetical protein